MSCEYISHVSLSQRGATLGLTVVLASAVVSGCGATEECDPEAVEAFQRLPRFNGVEVDLHGSSGIGCTETVEPADPDAFVAHYEEAMRHAGWEVLPDGDGVFGKDPSGGVRIDRLEGNAVGVYVLSPDDF
jgi:hypothetical protein